jgi:nitrogenase molybdenum-iron protein beta chain
MGTVTTLRESAAQYPCQPEAPLLCCTHRGYPKSPGSYGAAPIPFSGIGGDLDHNIGGGPTGLADGVAEPLPELGYQAVINFKAPRFLGSSCRGYEQFLDAIIDELLIPLPVKRRQVNILGIVPYQHVFWKGNLQVLKELLESIGLSVNMIFSENNGIEALRKIPGAELNLVFSHWCGIPAAKKLEEKFGTPFTVVSSVPVGPKDTSALLRFLARRLQLRRKAVERYIEAQELRAYSFAQYSADSLLAAPSGAQVAIVADAGMAIGLTRYGCNELGWLPKIVIITDNPPHEYREEIAHSLTLGLAVKERPAIHFEADAQLTRLLLREHSLQLVLGSSLEKQLAEDELRAVQVSVAFPVHDRIIVNRSYAGYRGGLALVEDVAYKCAGPASD